MQKIKFTIWVEATPVILGKAYKADSEPIYKTVVVKVVPEINSMEGKKKPFFEVIYWGALSIDYKSYEIVDSESSEDWKDFIRLEEFESFDSNNYWRLTATNRQESVSIFCDIPEFIDED